MFFNKGFRTPLRKTVLFADKPKLAFGDLKNITPMKLTTKPASKSSNCSEKMSFAPEISTPKVDNTIDCDEMFFPEVDAMLSQNENLMLSDDQFKLLFLEPNNDTLPNIPEPIDLAPDFPFFIDFTSDYESGSECGNNSEQELPAINHSFSWDDVGDDNRNFAHYF